MHGLDEGSQLDMENYRRGTHIYGLYKYVRPQRVGLFGRFGHSCTQGNPSLLYYLEKIYTVSRTHLTERFAHLTERIVVVFNIRSCIIKEH